MQPALRLTLSSQPCLYCSLRFHSRAFSSSPPALRQQANRRKDQSIPLDTQKFRHSPNFDSHDFDDPASRSKLRPAIYPFATTNHRRRTKPPQSSFKLIRHELTKNLNRLPYKLANDPLFVNLDISRQQLFTHYHSYANIIYDYLNDPTGYKPPPWLKKLLQDKDAILHPEAHDRSFLVYAIYSSFSKADIARQTHLAKSTCPSNWFSETRSIHRKFHLHIGPTNSGKTYKALQRLRHSENGYYAGPLRLLAHEVYSRLTADGLQCDLMTGDYRISADEDSPDPAPLLSCTVEMAPIGSEFDVAVIDEIQMMADAERGWAWTQAVLGTKAWEIHLCGEERVLPLVQQLVAYCGDTLEVHRYNRLSPLELMPTSLDGDLTKLDKGDCVVCFNVGIVHALRREIERSTNSKCAIIYGALPPEVRASQAALFNDPTNNYDVLICTDAVGLGLNLNIHRMIFQSVAKRTVTSGIRNLHVHEVKQIAGRAGRFSTAHSDMQKPQAQNQNSPADHPNASKPPLQGDESSPTNPAPPTKTKGYVTCLEPLDYQTLQARFLGEPDSITGAKLFPLDGLLERFSTYFPTGTPMSIIVNRFTELANSSASRLQISKNARGAVVCDCIEGIPGLTTRDKLIFMGCPAVLDTEEDKKLIFEYGKIVAAGRQVSVLDVTGLPLDLLEDNYTPNLDYLKQVERLNRSLTLHMWLSYKYPTHLIDIKLSQHVREICDQRILDVLYGLALDYNEMRRRRLANLGLADPLEERNKAAGAEIQSQAQSENESKTKIENELENDVENDVEDVIETRDEYSGDSSENVGFAYPPIPPNGGKFDELRRE